MNTTARVLHVNKYDAPDSIRVHITRGCRRSIPRNEINTYVVQTKLNNKQETHMGLAMFLAPCYVVFQIKLTMFGDFDPKNIIVYYKSKTNLRGDLSATSAVTKSLLAPSKWKGVARKSAWILRCFDRISEVSKAHMCECILVSRLYPSA